MQKIRPACDEARRKFDMGGTPYRARTVGGVSLSMATSQKSANEINPGASSVITVELWTSIEVSIPIGYQNETGFHYGTEFISLLLEPTSENGVEPLLS